MKKASLVALCAACLVGGLLPAPASADEVVAQSAFDALKAGASGYLLKTAELDEVVTTVLSCFW